MSERFSAAISDAERCVLCGLCLPGCPTYRQTGLEADSPRGRIALTRGVLAGKIPANERFIRHIDLCLGCMACEAACPNRIAYGKILDVAHEVAMDNRKTGSLKKALRAAALFGVSHPRMLEKMGALYRPLRRPIEKFAIPGKIAPLAKQLSNESAPKSTRYPARGKPLGEVGLFLGCVARLTDAQTANAAIYVLNALGYTVHVPAKQTCCGAIHRHECAEKKHLSEQNRDAFSGLDLAAIISTASGCGAELSQEKMPAKVMDISEFLDKCSGWEKAQIAPLNAKIAVHDPCSLKNVMHAREYPYRLLARIPQAEIVPLPDNDICCGGAGSYILREPQMANSLLSDKMSAWGEIGADFLATSNIGCALHLKTGIDADKVLHPVVIIARQMGYK